MSELLSQAEWNSRVAEGCSALRGAIRSLETALPRPADLRAKAAALSAISFMAADRVAGSGDGNSVEAETLKKEIAAAEDAVIRARGRVSRERDAVWGLKSEIEALCGRLEGRKPRLREILSGKYRSFGEMAEEAREAEIRFLMGLVRRLESTLEESSRSAERAEREEDLRKKASPRRMDQPPLMMGPGFFAPLPSSMPFGAGPVGGSPFGALGPMSLPPIPPLPGPVPNTPFGHSLSPIPMIGSAPMSVGPLVPSPSVVNPGPFGGAPALTSGSAPGAPGGVPHSAFGCGICNGGSSHS